MLLASLTGCSMDSGTVYAPGFHEKDFQALGVGVHSNEVVNILGNPLRAEHQIYSERWLYSPRRLQQSAGSFVSWEGTLPLGGVVLSFGETGTVISTFGTETSFNGKSRLDVKAILGEPPKTETNAELTIFHYTEGIHSGSHDVRAVFFDKNGKVILKRAFFYRD